MILQTQASTLAALLCLEGRYSTAGLSVSHTKNRKRNIIAKLVPEHTPSIPSNNSVSNDRTSF